MMAGHPDVIDDPRENVENVTVLKLKRLQKAHGLTVDLSSHDLGCRPCGSTWVRCRTGAALAIREQAAWDALEAMP